MAVPTQRKKHTVLPGYLLPAIRVTCRKEHKEGRFLVPARYKIKCGCCEEKVEIYASNITLEINGVDGSIRNWREILLPLLRIKKVDGEFVDVSEEAKRVRKQLKALREKYKPS